MTYSAAIGALSPLRDWRMGGSSSPVADQTGRGGLTVAGGVFGRPGGLPAGEDDGAVRFAGSGSASAPLNLSATSVVTVAASVIWDAYASDDALLWEFTPSWNGNAGAFIVDPNNSGEAGTISIGCGGPSGKYRVTIPQTALPAGAYHHLVVVYDLAGRIVVYVDGVVVSSTLRDGAVPGGTFASDTLFFMSRGGSLLQGTGTLDSVAVWDRELTGTEVAALYAGVSGHAPTGGSGSALIVDADHPAASDGGDRAAALNPSTPLRTPGRAFALALPGDTIQIKAATAASLISADPAMYPAANDDQHGGDVWPGKDASSSRITVQGVEVGGRLPKWLGINSTNLTNWEVTLMQFGYDLGSGLEFTTNTTLIGPKDLWIHGCVYTGGGSNVLGFTGHCRWEANVVSAKLGGQQPNFLTGNGFRIVTDDGSSNVAGPDDWVEFVGNYFGTAAGPIQGEDAIQLILAPTFGNALVEGNHFGYVQQTGAAHTDAIQSTGCGTLIIRGNDFGLTGPVDSHAIGSDGTITSLTVENNLSIGSPTSGFSMQFSGVESWLIRHNTYVNSRFGGLRLYSNNNLPASYGGTIVNNIVDLFEVDIPNTGAGWVQHHNLIGAGDALAGDTIGFAEFGTSSDTPFELATSPASPGIDAGVVTSLTTDRLGRPRSGLPDLGCHEAQPAVVIAPEARAPIVVSKTPSSGATGVAAKPTITLGLFPVPGEHINPATVTSASFKVAGPDGVTIPTVAPSVVADAVTTSPAAGYSLMPWTTYAVTATTAIADTQGNHLASTVSWSFRTAGQSPAILVDDPGAGSSPSVIEDMVWTSPDSHGYLTIPAGNTEVPAAFTLLDPAGAPADLANATTVELVLIDYYGLRPDMHLTAAIATPTSGGRCSYAWQTGDTTQAGYLLPYAVVTWRDGHQTTVPARRGTILRITDLET
jgi:hypothetical protein